MNKNIGIIIKKLYKKITNFMIMRKQLNYYDISYPDHCPPFNFWRFPDGQIATRREWCGLKKKYITYQLNGNKWIKIKI